MKKSVMLFGIIAVAFISCRETPSPVPKTPPVDNPTPKPEPKTVAPGSPVETSDPKNH